MDIKNFSGIFEKVFRNFIWIMREVRANFEYNLEIFSKIYRDFYKIWRKFFKIENFLKNW